MAEKTETEINPKMAKKPKWMKILEKQSWQAELVISGAAIFGSLQLPGTINELIDFGIYYISDKTSVLFYVFSFYLMAVAVILIVNFIIHFVLRALWIGMLGLVSVYPKGINHEFESYSEDYNQKIKKEFPDINQFNQRLDNLCSIMFAGTALYAMIFLSIIIAGLVLALLTNLIHSFFPQWDFTLIFLSIAIPLLLPGMLQSIFLLKNLREKEWVKKIHFPIYKNYAKGMFNIFYTPVNYIQLTLGTNSGLLKAGLFSFFYGIIVTGIALKVTENSNIELLGRNDFKNHNNSSTKWSSTLYENLIPEDSKIFGPTIPSDRITTEDIKLFIPRFGREEMTVDSICPNKWTYNDSLSVDENDDLKLKSRMECHNKYYHIYLNDSLLTNLRFYNFQHPNKNEPGYITHIPSVNCKNGSNEIKIVLGYKIPRTDEYKQYRIPFRYIDRFQPTGLAGSKTDSFNH